MLKHEKGSSNKILYVIFIFITRNSQFKTQKGFKYVYSTTLKNVQNRTNLICEILFFVLG